MNFTPLQDNNIKLILLNKKYAQEILNNNRGNVRDYFIPFDNIVEVKEWIDENENKIESGDKLETIIMSDTNEFLGMIALDNLNDEVAEIRIWLKPEIQGKGIGKKSTKLLLNWFIEKYSNKQIRYVAETINISSINLAKSLGLKFSKHFIDEDKTESVEYLLF